jgi:hypothetical protein
LGDGGAAVAAFMFARKTTNIKSRAIAIRATNDFGLRITDSPF